MELRPKKIKGRITVLLASPYKDSMVYIRQIDKEIFEYLVVYKGQVYANYMVFKLDPGKRFTKEQVKAGMNMLQGGAMATVDALRGDTISDSDKKLADDMEQVTKAIKSKVKE